MYKLIEKKYFIENLTYIGYGIETSDGECCVEDVSTEKNEVEKLIEVCNDFRISPVHLRDIVIDFINNA